MSVQKVREYLKQYGRDGDIVEHKASTATVEEAAAAFGVEPAQIAKTMAFHGKDGHVLLVLFAGDARADNHKFKTFFGCKSSMLKPDEVLRYTGHPVGGVCPFALPDESLISVYLDISLKRFATVYPACGSGHTGIAVTPEDLFVLAHAQAWTDVGRDWRESGT